ncbi:hypothetical protein RRG08_017194 [Elysia crispata]|uniref:Uncharacterized protein n=1 Tax=Elysia crispata TaxID=231223 RepID=A0AAE1CMS9_9GAST|nr:hypothetical protein RRG08_017194 [Elysia crispata]
MYARCPRVLCPCGPRGCTVELEDEIVISKQNNLLRCLFASPCVPNHKEGKTFLAENTGQLVVKHSHDPVKRRAEFKTNPSTTVWFKPMTEKSLNASREEAMSRRRACHNRSSARDTPTSDSVRSDMILSLCP